MHILGITGPIGHGKTTFAEALSEIYPDTLHMETGTVIAEVADAFHAKMPVPPEQNNIAWMNKWLAALPTILRDVVRIDTTYEQLAFTDDDVHHNPTDYQKFFQHSVLLTKKPELAAHQITSENKSEYRPILQWLGGYLVKQVNPTIWYDEIFRRVRATTRQTGTELAVIGGLRYPNDAKAVRDEGGIVVKIRRPDIPEEDVTDLTERGRSAIKPEVTVINNGTIDELKTVASHLLGDLRQDSLMALYIATAK